MPLRELLFAFWWSIKTRIEAFNCQQLKLPIHSKNWFLSESIPHNARHCWGREDGVWGGFFFFVRLWSNMRGNISCITVLTSHYLSLCVPFKGQQQHSLGDWLLHMVGSLFAPHTPKRHTDPTLSKLFFSPLLHLARVVWSGIKERQGWIFSLAIFLMGSIIVLLLHAIMHRILAFDAPLHDQYICMI